MLYLGPYDPVMAISAKMTAVLTRLPRPWLLKTSTTVRPRKFFRLLRLLALSLAELDAWTNAQIYFRQTDVWLLRLFFCELLAPLMACLHAYAHPSSRISMQLSLLARPQSVGTTCVIACCAKPCKFLLSCCRQFTYPWNWHWIAQDAKTPFAASVSMALITLHNYGMWTSRQTYFEGIRSGTPIPQRGSEETRGNGIFWGMTQGDLSCTRKQACEASLSSVFSTPRSTFRD